MANITMKNPQKLCDDIDSIIVMPNIKNVDDLVRELKAKGYGINRGKYLAIKPKNAKRAIRTFRLGDGYSLEHLQYRIENKNLEMPLSEVLKYDGVQREWAMCIRQIQIEIYRKQEKDRLHLATYREVTKSLDVLNFICKNNIHSVSDFEKKITAAEKKITDLLDERQELLNKIKEAEYFREDVSELREQLADLDGRIAEAKSESKIVSEMFQTYTDNMKSDYEIFLERAKAEIEEIRLAEERQIAEREERQQEEEYDSNYYYDEAR